MKNNQKIGFVLSVEQRTVGKDYRYAYLIKGKVNKSHVNIHFQRTLAGPATGKQKASKDFKLREQWTDTVQKLLVNTKFEKTDTGFCGGEVIQLAIKEPSRLWSFVTQAFRPPPSGCPENYSEWLELAEVAECVADGTAPAPVRLWHIAEDRQAVTLTLQEIPEEQRTATVLDQADAQTKRVFPRTQFKALVSRLRSLPVGGSPQQPDSPGLYVDQGSGGFYSWDTQVLYGHKSERLLRTRGEAETLIKMLTVNSI